MANGLRAFVWLSLVHIFVTGDVFAHKHDTGFLPGVGLGLKQADSQSIKTNSPKNEGDDESDEIDADSVTSPSSLPQDLPEHPLKNGQFRPGTPESLAILEATNGWPQTLSGDFEKNLRPDRSYLGWVFVNPRFGVDFSAPDRAASSLKSFRLDKLMLGHNMLIWQCQTRSEVLRGTVGYSGELDNQGTQMVLDGWGLTPFLAHYRDGVVENAEKSERHLANYVAKKYTVHSMVYELPSENCVRALKFVKNFISPKHLVDLESGNAIGPEPKRFGFSLNPLEGRGAGCSSFVWAAFISSGFFGDTLPMIWRDLQIPKQVLGIGKRVTDKTVIPFGDWTPPKDLKLRRIRPFQIQNLPWDGPIATSLRLLDPELIYLFHKSMLEGVVGSREANSLLPLRKLYYSAIPSPYVSSETYHDYPIGFAAQDDRQSQQLAANSIALARALLAKGYLAEDYESGGVKYAFIQRR